MELRERMAKIMYEAPNPQDESKPWEFGDWELAHPEDREWWLSRADALIDAGMGDTKWWYKRGLKDGRGED